MFFAPTSFSPCGAFYGLLLYGFYGFVVRRFQFLVQARRASGIASLLLTKKVAEKKRNTT